MGAETIEGLGIARFDPFAGPPRIHSARRVGIRPDGRAPARALTTIVADDGTEAGTITSGGFGPSVNGPIAMGYVAASGAAIGATVDLLVRGTERPARIVPLPFVPTRYYRP